MRWRRDEPQKLRKLLLIAMGVTALLSLLLPWLLQDTIVAMTVVGLSMALWLFFLTFYKLHSNATRRHGLLHGLTSLSRSQWGMTCAHLGVTVTVVGIAFSQNYSVERDVRMKAGDSTLIDDYRFTFEGVRDVAGPNWQSAKGTILITRNDKPEATLKAEKHFYTTSSMIMTEAAIDAGITRDLCAALGEELDDGSWAVRLYYKPFMRWIDGIGRYLVHVRSALSLAPRRSGESTMNRRVLFITLALFLLLAVALLWQLVRNSDGDDPMRLESALIGKPIPAFRLESLDVPGKPTSNLNCKMANRYCSTFGQHGVQPVVPSTVS